MSKPTVSTGAQTNQSLDTVHPRNPVRRLTDRLIPDGLCWLAAPGLPHPEAARADQLAFPFLVGRLERDGVMVTVHEAELVVAASLAAGRSETQAADDLGEYARFVVASVPTVHARLGGRALAAWLAVSERRPAGGD